jgi:hypothetical protein
MTSLGQSHSCRRKDIIDNRVKNGWVNQKLPPTQQVLEEKVVNVVPDKVLDVAIMLPAYFAPGLNNPTDLQGYVCGEFSISNPRLLKIAPC